LTIKKVLSSVTYAIAKDSKLIHIMLFLTN